MSKIEHTLALPLKRNVNRLQLAIGSTVAMSGVLLVLGHLLFRF